MTISTGVRSLKQNNEFYSLLLPMPVLWLSHTEISREFSFNKMSEIRLKMGTKREDGMIFWQDAMNTIQEADICPCCNRPYDLQDSPVTTKKAPASDFEMFWKAYPKKTAKAYCKSIWDRKGLTAEMVMDGLRLSIASRDWQKDGGQFIPNPSTWLNQGRWEDEGIDLVALKPERPSFLKPTQKVDHQDYIAWKAREEYPPSILQTQFREDPDFIQQTYLKQLTK